VSISSLDLNLLLVLDAVLSERSVARAARRLHVTPSAVSNALARLRSALDDPLVARSGRGIVPTPRAVELAPAIARALRDLDEAVHRRPFDPLSCERTFTLAIADVGQMVHLSALAALIQKEMPRARLRVVGIDSLVSLGGLAGTEVDVALGVAERTPGIRAERLFDERVVLVSRRDHPATGKRLSRSALESLRHVGVEMAPGRGFRDPAAQAFARAGVHRHIAVVVPTFTTAAAVVADTDMVASLPASLLDVVGRRFALRPVSAPIKPYAVPMSLRWHERTHADPAVTFFRGLVRKASEGFRRRGRLL
jgi:DNA-binding transcriptional LysR family regulator